MTEIIYTLIHFLPLAILAALKLIPLLIGADDIGPSKAPLYLMLALSCLFGVLISVNRKIRFIISGSFFALLLGVFLVSDKQKLRVFLNENSWITIAFLLTVLVVFVGFWIIRVRIVKLIAAILLAGLLISSYWTLIIDQKIEVASIMFFLFLNITEEIRNHYKKDNLSKKYLVCIVPFIFAGAILLFSLPVHDKPYDWALVKQIVNNIGEKIEISFQKFGGDNFETLEASAGFSEDGKLTGNLRSSDDEMMTISIGINSPRFIYLDGKYFDSFDGRNWTKEVKEYPYMYDMIEMECALSSLEKDKKNDLCRRVEYKIEYISQNTKYIFAPLKTQSIVPSDKKVKLSMENESPKFEKKRGKTTEYTVNSLLLNQNDKLIQTLCEAGSNIDKSQWDSACSKLELVGDMFSFENYLEYKDNLKQYIPTADGTDDLSVEVRAFLSLAIEGAENDYEKLLGIEAALKQFEYTTTPGNMPKEIDTPSEFLDYFLLDSKKGYCNSFATAFVLLCRAAGIPARYVQGYCVPNSKESTQTIYSSMAHAYPEAYLEGIGWMVFDPTPGFVCKTMWDERGVDRNPPDSSIFKEHNNETEIIPDEPQVIAEEETEERIKWYMVVVPASMFVFALFLTVLSERIISRYRFNKLDEQEKTYAFCKKILGILKSQGLKKETYETIREYASRVEKEKSLSLSGFVEAFEKYLYSDSGVPSEVSKAVFDEYFSVLEDVKKNSKLLFFYFRLWN